MVATDIVVAVWGEWHRNAFLRMNLPSLMTPDNLPKFASMIESRWKFYTTANDRQILLKDALFQKFSEHVTVEWIEIAKSEHDNFSGIDVHGRVWIEGMRNARAAQKFVMFMPPDVIWSDGGFGHFADLIVNDGKRAIYINWHLRAISESFIPEFHERYGTGGEPISATAQDLVRLSLDHIHPLSSIYLRNSQFFPRHSEMMFWPVPGEGVLMHVFALTPFIFDTTRFEYTDRKLVSAVEDPSELHYVVDSDDLFIVSLAELGKDRDWYEPARPFDFVRHAEWWHYYDSPANDHLTPQPFRLKFTQADESKWQPIESSARFALRRAFAAREVYRMWKLAKQLECHRAGFFLAYILRNDLAHRIIDRFEPSTILLPNDEHLKTYFHASSEHFTDPANFKDLRRLVRAHILPGDPINQDVMDDAASNNRPSEFIQASQSGDDLNIQQVSAATNLKVNEARIISEAYEAGVNKVFVVDRPVLPSFHFYSGD